MNIPRCIDGSHLKLLAVLTMVVDHVAAFGLVPRDASLYPVLRMVGRISFPLFAFLVVEGFVHTGDRRKYGRNLLFLAILSEIPWNLACSGEFLYARQNVLFTLFMGYLGLCIVERCRQDGPGLLLGLAALFVATFLLRPDYGVFGCGFILLLYVLFYLFPGPRELSVSLGFFVYAVKGLSSCVSFLGMLLYNGRRGFIRGEIWKWVFYLFYPVHLVLILLLREFVF